MNRWEKNGAGSATVDDLEKLGPLLDLEPWELIKPEGAEDRHARAVADAAQKLEEVRQALQSPGIPVASQPPGNPGLSAVPSASLARILAILAEFNEPELDDIAFLLNAKLAGKKHALNQRIDKKRVSDK